MFESGLLKRAEDLLSVLRSQRLALATAESCTGGLIAALMTEIPGSSDVLDRGFVTYSNEAKTDLIGVPAALIAAKGAVSREVAEAMATGAVARARALPGGAVAVAVTGVAGPGGGTAAKPVGLVHIAVARRGGSVRHQECRFGEIGRRAIRLATARAALDLISAEVAS